MSTLVRFAWREVWRSRVRLALVALVLAIQAAALGGGFAAERSLRETRDALERELRLADLDVRFVPASDEEMPSLEALRAIPGVAAVARRFVALGYVEKPDGAPLPVVVHYLDPEEPTEVDDLWILSGRPLVREDTDAAVIERSFAEEHGVALGAELVVNPRRFATRLRVVGTALSPEYLVPTANPELLVPHRGSLGVVFASRAALDRTFVDRLYDDLVFTFQAGADRRATTDAVLAALGDLEIERVMTRESSFGHRYVEIMLDGARVVTPAIALLFAAMAAIVTLLSVQRLVMERRPQLGCLLAQGFAPGQLVVGFASLGLAAGVAGAALGVPAAIAFGAALARISAHISGFPTPIMTYAAGDLATGAGVALAVGVASAVPPALGVLRLRPAEAFRTVSAAGFVGAPRALERGLLGSASTRYAVRNVFRRRQLSAAIVAFVALAVGLPAALLTSLASWESWARTAAARFGWDAVVTFKVPLGEEHVRGLAIATGADLAETYVQGYATVHRELAPAEEMRVRGLPVPSALVRPDLVAGRAFRTDDADEAILNAGFASGVRAPAVGEAVTLVARGRSRTLVVVGLVRDPSPSTLLVPRGTADRIFGAEGRASGAYLRFADRADDATARKRAVLEDELVTSVQLKTEYAAETARYLSAFHATLLPFVGLSALLAFTFLSGVLGILMAEREGEYATLRALGSDRRRIAGIVLTEVAVLAAFGIAASAAAWALFSLLLREPMARAWFHVPLDLRALDFGVVAGPTLVCLAAAAVPAVRRVMRVELASVLRARGIG